jgi:hypothetical protein
MVRKYIKKRKNIFKRDEKEPYAGWRRQEEEIQNNRRKFAYQSIHEGGETYREHAKKFGISHARTRQLVEEYSKRNKK